jgi:GT2 family glycosyltransferase
VETDPQLVPSVVSVMVVHQPGDWFDETLEALAEQDYPNLRTLFLVTATDDDQLLDLTERIRHVLPAAFVRPLPANAGFGPAANEVLRLVEGDNGFFLICHDDVALERGAIRLMVAELFRSNAGLVGPKLVEWDQPRVLQHVGLGLDRFGEVDPIIDPGEVDQEQHDAVRDVFVLPSACVLVRADLFRALGGFDPTISFHGEDVDLCWRAHLTGARVIVAPDARARHRERLTERRPDLGHRTLQSRHRMRTVATLTGGSRLVGRTIQMALLTLVELVVGLFTGRFAEAIASLRALVGLAPRALPIARRRREIRGQRAVPEREILGLQDRGSSRLTSYLRGKETTTFVGAESTVRRWREASFGPVLAWFVVVLAVIVGSREFIRQGVPPVGEFLPFPASPSDMWDDYRASFDSRSFGSAAAAPTGWAMLAVTSAVALFRMELFMTMTVVGLYLLGAVGAWRLATVFPVNRARIAGMVIYVGTPLVPGLLSRGDWSALAWFAALPWLVHLLRRAAGLEAADPAAAELDLADGVIPVALRDRARALAFLTLTLAMTAAFVPVVVVLWAAVGIMIALATIIAGGSWRVSLWLAGCTALSTGLALLLNLPWALEWTWESIVDVPLAGSTGRDLAEVASLSPSSDRFAILAIALYLPILAAVAITRAWRLTWSVRAAALVLGFGALMIFAERGAIDVPLPRTSLLAVPVALGLALGGAAIAGGFGSDVLGRGFGWRQPLAVLSNAAIIIGLVPAVLAIGDGSWHTPRTPMPRLLATQLQSDPAVGDFRTLYVGDPRVLPVPAREYRRGIGYAVTDAGSLDFSDRFQVPASSADDAVERALDLIASGSTLRGGRILAPLGIRYVILPKTDGVESTVDDPLPMPEGLLAALQNQLDIGAIPGQPSLEVFVNQAFMPVGAQLTGTTAEASRAAGEEALVRADLTQAVPSMLGADGVPSAANEVAPGVVHIAIPADQRLRLEVDGREIQGRTAFGVTTAFDVETTGAGVLSYERDASRGWWIATQMVLWLVVLVVAAGARAPFVRRRGLALVHDETLIDLTDSPTLGVAGEALGPPTWADTSAGPSPTGSGDVERAHLTADPSADAEATRSASRALDEPDDEADDEVDLAALVVDPPDQVDGIEQAGKDVGRGRGER